MASLSGLVHNHQLTAYFLLTYLITWTIFCIPFVMVVGDTITTLLVMAVGGSGPAFAAIILSGILGPEKLENQVLKRWCVFIGVMVVTGSLIIAYYQIPIRTISGPLLLLILINAGIAAYIISGGLAPCRGIRELLRRLYIRDVAFRWYAVALLFTPVALAVSVLIVSLYTGVSLNGMIPQFSAGALFSVIISFGFVALVRGPLREEIGWRGFALPRLQYLYSPLVGTLILGVIWTVWHLPLHLNGVYSGGFDGFIERFYFNIGLTFLITWIYNHSKGSLLLTTLFHASLNTTFTVILLPEIISGPITTAFYLFVNGAAIVVVIRDAMWRRLPEYHAAVCPY